MMTLYTKPAGVRSHQYAQSARGERRGFKIPGLSKLRIGGSIGKAAESLKKKLPSVPSMVLSNAIPGGSLIGSAINGTVKQDFQKGLQNLPLVMAGVKMLGGNPSIPGLPGGGGAGGGGMGGGLDTLLGGLSAYNAAQLGKKSGDYAQQAHDTAYKNWNSREPLRMAGVQGMLSPQPSALGQQTLGNLGAIQSRNPYAVKPKLSMGAPTNGQ